MFWYIVWVNVPQGVFRPITLTSTDSSSSSSRTGRTQPLSYIQLPKIHHSHPPAAGLLKHGVKLQHYQFFKVFFSNISSYKIYAVKKCVRFTLKCTKIASLDDICGLWNGQLDRGYMWNKTLKHFTGTGTQASAVLCLCVYVCVYVC